MIPYESGPTAKAYRNLRRAIRNCAVFFGVLMLGVLLFGLPHVLVEYRGHSYRGEWTHVMDRRSGWYWSVTGWKEARAGQFSRIDGCPYVLLIPLNECVDLPWSTHD